MSWSFRVSWWFLFAGVVWVGAAAVSTRVEAAEKLPHPAMPALAAAVPGSLLYRDDFSDPAVSGRRWIVEQQPGGTVQFTDGRLVIEDAGGCTVWFRYSLPAPVVITYEATVRGEPRVSDLNCFWMASDPDHPDDLFAEGHGRTGAFATYDQLRLYYVGYGGNTNSTTRFRRYVGGGPKPLLPEHDRTTPEFLLQADHPYRIALVAAAGRAQFIRDGEVVFDFTDAEPLKEGWFGFRTVHSRIEIREFRVWEGKTPPN